MPFPKVPRMRLLCRQKKSAVTTRELPTQVDHLSFWKNRLDVEGASSLLLEGS